MLTVQHILDRKKDQPVACIGAEDTVLDAARLMNERRIGALVVVEGSALRGSTPPQQRRVIGIFSERDVLNRIVAAQRPPAGTKVGDVMTAPIACCTPDTPLSECRSVMRSKRIRHLPVVQEGALRGMISIGDILEDERADQSETIRYLHEYLYGGEHR